MIRVFKKKYSKNEDPNLSEIVKDDVDFYAHCVTKLGIKMGFWEKVGNNNEIGEINHILFRGTNDYGHKLGEEPIRVSHKWYIWKINNKDFTRVGKLEGKNKILEIGGVINPRSIVYRIQTGMYDFTYPEYE